MGTPADLAARVRELEQAVSGSKHERGLLLRRLIAAEDQLRAHGGAKPPHDGSAKAKERETPTTSIRVPVETGKRISLPALMATSIAVAAIAVAAWYFLIQRPLETQLINQRDAARQQADAGGVELEKLRAVVAERAAQPAPIPPTPAEQPPAPAVPTPPSPDPAAANLAAERKALQTKSIELDNERGRLAQQKREIDGEYLKLADARRQFDEARLAVPPKPEPMQLLLPPATAIVSGSLTWRASIKVPTAVMITGNSANFGTVTGALPRQPAHMRIMTGDAVVTLIEGPQPTNGWNRLYFKIEGQGSVTVFLSWVAYTAAPGK